MKQKFTFIILSIALSLGIIVPISIQSNKNIDKNAIYDTNLSVSFDNPTLKSVSKAVTNWPERVKIHYHNDDGTNNNRTFYFWFSGLNGKEYLPDQVSSDNKDMSITLDFTKGDLLEAYKKKMFMIIKNQGTWTGKSDDTPISFVDFPPNSEGLTEIWCIPGEGTSLEQYASEKETQMDKVLYSSFLDWKRFEVICTKKPTKYRVYALTSNYYKLSSQQKQLYKNDYLLTSGTAPQTETINYNSNPTCQKFVISLKYTIRINVQYMVEAVFESNESKWMSKNIAFDSLYNTDRFNQFYLYNGNDLGVTYTKEATTFKVWAPTATRVMVMLFTKNNPSDFSNGSDEYGGYEMSFRPGGVWELTITGKDLNNRCYNYYVINSLGSSEVTDPYAKACNVNGDRGLILNFDSTNPDGWDNVPLRWDGEEGYDISSPNELSVYEVHVRDLTSHESWNGSSKPGTFDAFKEKGTHLKDHPDVSTGFDHIEQLGVKALQLLPVFDSDNDEINYSFNWGYNPKNYNCVDGAFSKDPTKGASRIKEFKSLIKAYAENANHTRIIMDVVYNHVSSAPQSSFHKLMPKYYFRYIDGSIYADGSGCGNEVNTEAPMMRKFIVESLVWWAKEYKIKGFRFDLMGLIDCETLKQASEELFKIDPDIVMYGEGWTAGGYNGSSINGETANVYSELYATPSRLAVGGFNDCGRDAMRGNNDPGYGYLQQGPEHISSETRERLGDMLWGIHSGKGANPSQTVNYVSCHDNFTLYDQLFATLGDGTSPASTKVLCDTSISAHAFVMASNGIAFMLGGEELFRTKIISNEIIDDLRPQDYKEFYGVTLSHNSYNSPDSVNAFDWNRKIKIDDLDTSGYFDDFKAAIDLHQLMPKFPYSDSGFPYAKTSAGNDIISTSWAGSEKGSSNPQTYNGCSGFQLDEYFVFLAGRQWGWIQFGDVPKSTKLYEAGFANTFDNINGTVNLGDFEHNTGGSIVIFKRG